jgi:hypothetical protein
VHVPTPKLALRTTSVCSRPRRRSRMGAGACAHAADYITFPTIAVRIPARFLLTRTSCGMNHCQLTSLKMLLADLVFELASSHHARLVVCGPRWRLTASQHPVRIYWLHCASQPPCPFVHIHVYILYTHLYISIYIYIHKYKYSREYIVVMPSNSASMCQDVNCPNCLATKAL